MNRYFLLPLFYFLLQNIGVFASNKNFNPDSVNNLDAPCSPYSTLPCTGIQVALPYSLSFNAAVNGTLADKNGAGMGFTMAIPNSGARLAVDGASSVPDAPGYEPSKLTVTGGRLSLVTNKGIDYLTNNNGVNILGVQIQQSGKINIEASVINPLNSTQAQQAGVWYGLNDHTSIKLDISGNKVELRRELNDVSSNVVGASNPDQRITAVIANLNTKTVRLRLTIDATTQTAQGFYSVDGGTTYVSTGAAYPTASINISGMGLTNAQAYAAIYATHRNATTPVTYTFDDFSVKSDAGSSSSNTPCPPFSTLPCANIQVALPYSLSFDAAVNNTLVDKNGAGVGFTMALPYSGTRLAVDGTPSDTDAPGYEPSKLTLTGGRLSVVTNKGIDYQANNNAINILGVQVQQTGKINIEASVINPLNGTSSQQAGVWYGLNDHTSIKLDISGNKVELRRELNDVSSTVSGTTNPDQRITAVISNLNTKTVRLRLSIDAASQIAEGFYSTDGGATYISTGAAYPTPLINISGMGLTNATAYAAIYATHRNATTAVTYTFDDFSVKNDVPVNPGSSLKFSSDSLTYTIFRGGAVKSQSVTLSAGGATPTVTFKALNATWLHLPSAAVGTVTFGPANISSDLAPGTYKGSVVAQASGYQPDTLGIRIIVVDGVFLTSTNVNFQDAASIPPSNWIRDFGQAYAFRTAPYQSSGLQFGWKKKSDSTPINITSNGFNRNEPEDVTLSTLIYMQANNISGTFSGTKTEAFWEIKVPNGTYDVSVSAGDGVGDGNPESDNLTVEGVKAITGFVPSGLPGAITRFKQATVRVAVKDEHVTITADGGTNTKINYANISPVSISPFLGWSDGVVNILVAKGSTGTKTFSLMVGNSDNKSLNYALSSTYNTGTPGWLSMNASQTGVMPVVTFNYTAAAALPIGSYSVAVRASATGYSSTYTNVYLRVVDGNNPYVISSSPENAAVKVSPNTVSVAANHLSVPAVTGFKGGVDNSTITSTTVKLYKLIDNVATEVQGVVQGTGGGDAISFSPKFALDPNTTYRFNITNGVKSYSGAAFTPYTSTFVTDSARTDSTTKILNAQFTKVTMPGTSNKKYTTLRFGPDDKFYALRLDGAIERYTVNHSTGMLSNQQIINTLITKYGNRSAIGLVFDPASTAANLICYVTHSSSGLINSPSFDGNISKLTGADLQTETLMITKLPRSTRDHMSNSLQFGPDGAMYLSQGSNSSAGAFDADWQRAESLLSGTILRIDMQKLNAVTLPLNVQTTATQSVINAAPAASRTMSDGTYNPYSTVSPVTIYASGVRNAYDLLWHSNGQLYIPTNGSGGGGNSPASVNGTRRPNGTTYQGPAIPATTDVQVQVDWLFRVNPLKAVGYFGHPNPLRGEYVENRGYTDNPLYPVNVVPDANYRGAAYNFGLNHSPNGVIEYKSNTFNGALKNKILVCRFSGGGDIMVLKPGSLVKVGSINNANSDDHIYDITEVTTGSGNFGLVGMSGFANPINLVEDPTNGNLYVIEYNWNANANLVTQITLLKVNNSPNAATGLLSLSAGKASDIHGLITYKNYDVAVANKGDGDLKIKDIRLTGRDAANFNIQGIPLPTKDSLLTLKKNASLSFMVSAPANLSTNQSVKLRVTSVEDSVKEVELKLQPDSTGSSSADSLQFNINTLNKKAGSSLTVYPNPNLGEVLHIQLSNYKKLEKVNVALFDIMGIKLKSVDLTSDLQGNCNTAIQMPKVVSTSYFIIRAVSPSGSKEAKVMLQK
ncbi:Ig-like domain-containing protein [Mucilaginibacter aquaedulcis]|uniref:Ig-like domain-containing protein n=1 Tax=Mucilaginibacter aquaedulcis TaxID=1187081 RepID=UPI0025B29563|nr:Ig-like domain-containing protein [Mucilaginibacter aquaedulcis]MDN3550487.1 Ig-like domain-containing protein [Mucilaginibacter aquaedulcis]